MLTYKYAKLLWVFVAVCGFLVYHFTVSFVFCFLFVFPWVLWGFGGFRQIELVSEWRKIVVWYVVVGVLFFIFHEPPENFYSCLLKNIDGAANNYVARLVLRECKKKYPERKQNEKRTDLTFDECVKKYAWNVSSEDGIRYVKLSCNALYKH